MYAIHAGLSTLCLGTPLTVGTSPRGATSSRAGCDCRLPVGPFIPRILAFAGMTKMIGSIGAQSFDYGKSLCMGRRTCFQVYSAEFDEAMPNEIDRCLGLLQRDVSDQRFVMPVGRLHFDE